MTRLVLVGAVALSGLAFSQKKPLDESVYDGWRSLSGTTLSEDGRWVAYDLQPQEGDGVLTVQSVDGTKTITVDRGTLPKITKDGKFLIASIVPPFAELRDARLKKTKPEDMPKNSLLILNLTTGEQTKLPNVQTFTVPDEDMGWIVYRPEPPKPEPAKPDAAKPEAPKTTPSKEADKTPKKKADHKVGDEIVLRQLATGKEIRVADVASYRFDKDGGVLVYSLSTKDGSGDGVVWMDLASGKSTTVLHGLGHYRFSLDEHATRLAVMTDKADYESKTPSQEIYVFDPHTAQTALVATSSSVGIPAGSYIPDTSTLTLSDKGDRILFGTRPRPVEPKKDDTPDAEKASVDIWNWQDAVLQPQQLLQVNATRNRTYLAVVLLGSKNKVVQLATPSMPGIQIGAKEESEFAIGTASKPYQIEASWDTGYDDVYLVDVATGGAQKVFTKFEGGFGISPTGKYAYGYDPKTRTGIVMDMATGNHRVVTDGLPYPIWNEIEDTPSDPGAYGVAGWTPDDKRLLIYDAWDVWSVDPEAKSKPICLTGGYGRDRLIRLRVVDLDRDVDFVDPTKPILLSGLNDATKAQGFYWLKGGVVRTDIEADKAFSAPIKAKHADIIAYTRMDFDEYPDLWLADNLDFKNPRKVSNANPQQQDYNWGKSELITWTSNDGAPLQGILIKPEDFDYSKKYPMIVYFYERNSDTLHSYRTPAPTASILNPTMAVSNDYIVFIPDIVYKEGYPGESAISCVMPGVQEVLRRGYVDPKRIGIDGQSWGGYQVAYMITETDMFACAYAGAPVSDMFSAYGGIRWGSGLVREFQYEKEQSRIGGSIWEKPLRFLENSPLFFLDKVKTPVLMMANDHDGSVPWYQGIEMFTGLRRLRKPSWLLVYNDEDHNLVQRKNRKDLSKRKQQFYDHYLKGAPMPKWMAEGVPAVDKGKDYGFELESKGG